MFRRMDDNNSGDLSREEFVKGLNDTGLHEQLTADEVQQLFDIFDTDHSGTINFNEFLRHIRVSLSQSFSPV